MALLLTFGAGRASADLISYELTTTNISGQPAPADYVDITVDRTSSTTASITFVSGVVNGATWLFHSLGAVGVEVNASTWTVGTIAGISVPGGRPNSDLTDAGSAPFDGYGSFNQAIDSKPGSDRWKQISFVLTNTSGTWSTAADVLTGKIAAAQVAPSDGSKTGFAGDAVTDGIIVQAAPEPSSMAIAALGTLGFVGYALRRRLKK